MALCTLALVSAHSFDRDALLCVTDLDGRFTITPCRRASFELLPVESFHSVTTAGPGMALLNDCKQVRV